jgi:glutathione S-transferase
MILVGRSSSHFTRTARLFALELGVPFTFQPVLDMTTLDPGNYATNPALKMPVLIDEHGPLYGTENICRELTLRTTLRARVILRGDVTDRLVANAEEMVLHGMATGVNLIMVKPGDPLPPKLRPSLDGALRFLEDSLDRVLALLPADRLLSFFEVSLFCLVTHLPFRKVMQLDAYPRLQAFARSYGARPHARATEYRFDVA